jgi:transposase
MKTHVGVDLHQRFCYLTAVSASGKVLRHGQVANHAAALQQWLGSVPGPRQVVVEASGFWPAFQRAARPQAERMVMVHPQRVKAIASAKLKNDRVDSATLAHLSRCDLLPEAWMADDATQQLRLRVRLRMGLGRQRARAKNQLQAVLHQEGFVKPVTDVFGKRGRLWLKAIALSAAGRMVVDTWLREVDHLDAEIGIQTRELERMAVADARARCLQSVPGIGAYSAMVILAEMGDVGRFANKQALASYAGLVPVVRESAGKRKRGGITHQGSNTLRWIMLQVAQVAARKSAPVGQWYARLRARKPAQVAKIALARKLLNAAWAMLRHGVCFDEQMFARS